MEEKKEIYDLLDMMVQPVFFVKENRILRSNGAAKQLLLHEGTPILPLLETGSEEYAAFDGGCLYLTVSLGGQRVAASVRRMEDMDLFELDGEDSTLQAMALASSQLRKPLGAALTQTMALLEQQSDPESLARLSQLNQSLYQMLRILGNMSDAPQASASVRMETMDAPGVIREIFEKAQTLARQSGRKITFEVPAETVYCLLNRSQLERAILNILSNALKFTPEDGAVDAVLTRRGKMLMLTVQDSGSGIAQEVMGSLYRRYQRQPGIEDGRFGMGLGLRMIQSAAAAHGGALLITQGESGGTRIIMTLAIRQKTDFSLGSPVFSIDYTGGFDHSLVELSEVLKPELYDGSF